MLNIRERPYGLLLFTAIALSLAVGILRVADIDFQDKFMFGVPLGIFALIVPVLLIFFWLLYLLTKRFLYSAAITWTHVLITIFTMILIVIILYIVVNPFQAISQNNYEKSVIKRPELIGNVTRIIFIVFACGQFTYVANVVLGFLQKGNKQKQS